MDLPDHSKINFKVIRRCFDSPWSYFKQWIAAMPIKIFVDEKHVRKNNLKIQTVSLLTNLPISHIVFIVCISVQLWVVCVLCIIAASQLEVNTHKH